jgi:YidC/Oxa1 family membrane protein insertase
MEKRVLLAIFLSFLVLYLYQALVVKPVPKTAGGSGAAAAQTRTGGPAAGLPPAAAPGQAASAAAKPSATGPAMPSAATAQNAGKGAPSPAAGGPVPATLVGEAAERDVRIETRDVIAVFTNRGARLKSWRLKHFFDPTRAPLELVTNELGDAAPLPFSLRVVDDAVTARLNGALYAVTVARRSGASDVEPPDLRFEYRDSAGVHAVKQFHFEPAPYIVSFQAEVTEGDRPLSPAIQWGPAVGDTATELSRFTKRAGALLSSNAKVQRLSPKDVTKQPTYDGTFAYAGVDDQYFLTAALFTGPSRVSYEPASIPPPAGSSDPPRELVSWGIEPIASGASPVLPMKFFAGPKDFDVLASIDREFVRAIDFGYFAFLVVPLLRSLKWINGYIGNYGWSIVVLTVFINAIMFPLRHKSVVSMRKMQEIQPEVKAIQDRYAKLKTTDPARQKMNQELMALYKERGVNPASGCVPMLLTLPVLFAFYSLLQGAIELRGAPFFGWIHDLSVHDPLYITPVLMGISQLWQQRITPAAGADPVQQKTMMLMPVMFTFMFLWAPAGVAIYWLVSNVWGIGQQYLTNYLIGPPNVRAVRPPAQRQMKRAGGSKTEAAARES